MPPRTRPPSPPAPGSEPARAGRGPSWLRPVVLADLFALSNLAFLGVDIALAHAVNDFHHPAERFPLWFSAGATVALLVAQLGAAATGGRGPLGRLANGLGLAVGLAAVGVGLAGLVFHLDGQFFRQWTIKSLVYAAPFAAPLAYTGVGLLVILNRSISDRSAEWGWWVVTLAMFGFGGNFLLCLTDHAQNGFFRSTEWVGVAAGAYAVGALVAVMVLHENAGARRLAWALMAAQVAVALVGFILHATANLGVESPLELLGALSPTAMRERWADGALWDAIVFGAPAFAPLLFADLAALAGLGLWGLARAVPAASAAAAPAGAAAP